MRAPLVTVVFITPAGEKHAFIILSLPTYTRWVKLLLLQEWSIVISSRPRLSSCRFLASLFSRLFLFLFYFLQHESEGRREVKKILINVFSLSKRNHRHFFHNDDHGHGRKRPISSSALCTWCRPWWEKKGSSSTMKWVGVSFFYYNFMLHCQTTATTEQLHAPSSCFAELLSLSHPLHLVMESPVRHRHRSLLLWCDAMFFLVRPINLADILCVFLRCCYSLSLSFTLAIVHRTLPEQALK